MKKSLFSAILALGTTFSLAAFAGEWTSSWSTITGIESFGDDLHVTGLNLSPNPSACSNTGLAKIDYRISVTEKRELGLILQAAFLGGRQVKVKLQTGYCQDGSVPAIYAVQVDD